MKTIYYFSIFLIFFPVSYAFPQSVNKNYIRSKDFTKEDASEYIEKIQYYDGLGRPEQLNQRGVSGNNLDLISLQEYDSFGRETAAWLPAEYPSEGNYIDPVTLKEIATQNDDKPYSLPVYEASPTGRITAQYGPGADWHDNKKAILTGYLTNNNTDSLRCIYYHAQGYGTNIILVKKFNYYPEGSLFVTRRIDEDSNRSYEFMNKRGQVVLTRQINNDGINDTYYVYDIYGNLCYVLPPLAANSAELGDDSNTLKHYAHLYKYDTKNRCIWSRLPGCEPVKYIYDKADRLIFSQDGEQDSRGEWLYTVSDKLGREVLRGFITETPPDISNEHVTAEFYSNDMDPYVLTCNVYFNISNPEIMTFYDNNYYLHSMYTPSVNLDYIDKAGYGKRCQNNKGRIANQLVAYKDTNGYNKWLNIVYYYDDKGRVIQSKSMNHLGGIDEEYTAYNFTGQPLKKLRVHSATGKTTQTETYTYQYDHVLRLIKTVHQLQEGTATPKPAVILAENTYDELGRLKTNKKNNNANLTSTYGYNVRSWTKTITSPLFSQTLYYNDQYAGSLKRYNGNVGAMTWQVQGDKLRGYTFVYDNLSQLTSTKYFENGTASNNYKTQYTYDKHGNMRTLQRYGKMTASTYGIVDNVTLTYTGNQLTKATDAIGTISLTESNDFKDYANTATEYVYNRNGAMTKDLNKGITDIQYNSLNLPKRMDIKSPVAEARNEYTYSAAGAKLKVVQKWNPNYSTAPIIGSSINVSSLTETKTTDYVGNIIYEDNALKRILVDGGYIENGQYHFYLTDHLGNNRVVTNASGTPIQKNHYYPFGMPFAETSTAEQGKQPYKFGGKELDQMHGLNFYDVSARYMNGINFTTIDPMAEKYYSWSPYVYCANNPLRFIDPTGMQYGDFVDAKGKVIGDDGIDDQRTYVMKTNASDESVKYIKENSGKPLSFKDKNNIAYQNSIEIECDPKARQDMVDEVSKDNGKGGKKDANNREYGGYVKNGLVTTVKPGEVANLKEDKEVSITLPKGEDTFHSHPSGNIVERSESNSMGGAMGNTMGGSSITVGSKLTTRFYEQPPSETDINNSGTNTNYVFGRGDKTTYIYNSDGLQATIPTKYFVTPKK